jgi:aryl-alcohol dehydrogenase-like predicted oxidoreductase
MSTNPADPNAAGNARKNLRQALDASLKRLRTDYLDLYWVHIWDRVTPLEELVRALDDAVRAGKVLYTGFSNAPAWVIARAQTLAELRAATPFAALQLQYSLVERNIEREHLPCADALGLAVTAWSPLGGGLLTGKYSRDAAARTKQPGRLTTTAWGGNFFTDRGLEIAEVVKRIAARLAASASQVAIAWLLARPRPVIPVIGTRNLSQLTDVLGATAVTLDEAALTELDQASRIEVGYPGSLLVAPRGMRMAHGDHLLPEVQRPL